MAYRRLKEAPSTWLLLGITALLGACTAPSMTRGGFKSPAPAARTHAVEETVRNAQTTGTVQRADLRSMVELLLADDSTVRFVAIAGLVELTGDDHGYRFFDSPPVRYQAILRWREYVQTTPSAPGLSITPSPANTTIPPPTVPANAAEAQG